MSLSPKYHPDRVLRTVSEPVPAVDEEVLAFIDWMFRWMYQSDCVGMSAIQLGVPLRLIVVDVPVFCGAIVNPSLGVDGEPYEGGPKTGRKCQESCASMPGEVVVVPRYEQVSLLGVNPEGGLIETVATGDFASVLQHEMDHLQGVMPLDYLAYAKRKSVEASIKRTMKRHAKKKKAQANA